MTTLLLNPLFFIKNLFTHLWLSVSSVKFYEKVFKKYNDYGALYIINLSLISSIVCTIIFLHNVDKIQDYLKHNIASERVKNIDFVIKQIPPIEYDGQNITIDSDEPIIIKNKSGSNALVIDPDNKTKPSDRNKFPLILLQNKIIISLINSEGKVQNTFPVKFDQIFGQTPRVLTNEEIESSLAKLLDQVPRVLVYMIFPLTVFLIFLNTFSDKVFFIAMIFLVTKISGLNLSIKTCIRLTMYASGFYALFQFIFLIAANEYSSIVWIVQSWTSVLMILGILSATGKNYFFRKN
jgi:hypothetical protein